MTRTKRLTLILTFSGALPFYLLLIPKLPFFDEQARLVAFLAYGAVIASFMAGSLWGAGQGAKTTSVALLLVSNVVALSVWASLLLPGTLAALILQLCLFIVLAAAERWAQAPAWYVTMRDRITGLVALAYLLQIMLRLQAL